jgi:hypothetical protein
VISGSPVREKMIMRTVRASGHFLSNCSMTWYGMVWYDMVWYGMLHPHKNTKVQSLRDKANHALFITSINPILHVHVRFTAG